MLMTYSAQSESHMPSPTRFMLLAHAVLPSQVAPLVTEDATVLQAAAKRNSQAAGLGTHRAAKRSRGSKRTSMNLESIGPITTAAEQALCKRLFFPKVAGEVQAQHIPKLQPNFTNIAVKFNEEVASLDAKLKASPGQVCCVKHSSVPYKVT